MSLKTLVKRLLPFLPVRLQGFIRAKAEERPEREKVARKERTLVAVSAVLERLADCGLHGDFMIHGSISNIGKLHRPLGDLVIAWIGRLDLSRQTVLCLALPYNTTVREYRRFALAKKFGAGLRRPYGDGSAIPLSRSDLIRKLSRRTRSVVSIDGYKASFLEDAWRCYQRDGMRDFVVIGHPKAITRYSLQRLDRFVGRRRSEDFVGFGTYQRFLPPSSARPTCVPGGERKRGCHPES